MPRKPNPNSPGNLILSHLLDVGGVIESDNVNKTLRDALPHLTSKQIGNAIQVLKTKGDVVTEAKGARTTRIALTDTTPVNTTPARTSKGAKRGKKRGAKPTLPPAPLSSPVPLYLGEQVTVVGLYLAGDTVGLALQRADDLIVNLSVVIPKD